MTPIRIHCPRNHCSLLLLPICKCPLQQGETSLLPSATPPLNCSVPYTCILCQSGLLTCAHMRNNLINCNTGCFLFLSLPDCTHFQSHLGQHLCAQPHSVNVSCTQNTSRFSYHSPYCFLGSPDLQNDLLKFLCTLRFTVCVISIWKNA